MQIRPKACKTLRKCVSEYSECSADYNSLFLGLARRLPESVGTLLFRIAVVIVHAARMSLFLIAKHQHMRFALVLAAITKSAIDRGLQ